VWDKMGVGMGHTPVLLASLPHMVFSSLPIGDQGSDLEYSSPGEELLPSAGAATIGTNCTGHLPVEPCQPCSAAGSAISQAHHFAGD